VVGIDLVHGVLRDQIRESRRQRVNKGWSVLFLIRPLVQLFRDLSNAAAIRSTIFTTGSGSGRGPGHPAWAIGVNSGNDKKPSPLRQTSRNHADALGGIAAGHILVGRQPSVSVLVEVLELLSAARVLSRRLIGTQRDARSAMPAR